MVSDETRRKMSEAAKRRASSPEARKAMSERQKAAMARPGVREKLSEATKKQQADPEKKREMDEARRQALKSPETRSKMSASAKKKFADPVKGEIARNANKEAMKRLEVRQKMSKSAKKRFSDPEQRKATSEATKAAMTDPERRAGFIKGMHDYWSNPEAREWQSVHMKQLFAETDLAERVSEATREAMKDVEYSPELIALRRKNMQARWADPKQRKALFKYRRTSIELIVGNLLDSLGVSYESQWYTGGFCIDFYVPAKRLAIECDGDYWHGSPGAKERDARKDEHLTKNGYKVLRLSESKINEGDFSELYSILEE